MTIESSPSATEAREDLASPLVSIVITCFNYGRFLRSAVASALSQTYHPIEAIIVDDGSTDDTPEIAATWSEDPRVRYVRQQNSGQAAAKNRGIQMANGDLIAFLDADDAWAPEKLARQVPLFRNPAVGVVSSGRKRIDEAGHHAPSPPIKGRNQPRCGRITSHLLFDNVIPFSSSVARREVLRRVGGFREELAMAIDWDLWLRVSVEWEFDFVAEPLMYYRVGHADQMSRNLEVRFACCDRIFEEFVREHAGRLRPLDVQRARAYTLRVRARRLERMDPRRALRGYLQSLRLDPFAMGAYTGVLRALLATRRRNPPAEP